ncbi:unnamed protein product [Moneuplotes crassus]|uniref:Uncharacterized protein n=1 Tax=Euplotes crassus TaxID=5936 RepID=A0AAD1XA26_EUPCR|nr:unnamed protein product [Moneuplotes crassus]
MSEESKIASTDLANDTAMNSIKEPQLEKFSAVEKASDNIPIIQDKDKCFESIVRVSEYHSENATKTIPHTYTNEEKLDSLFDTNGDTMKKLQMLSNSEVKQDDIPEIKKRIAKALMKHEEDQKKSYKSLYQSICSILSVENNQDNETPILASDRELVSLKSQEEKLKKSLEANKKLQDITQEMAEEVKKDPCFKEADDSKKAEITKASVIEVSEKPAPEETQVPKENEISVPEVAEAQEPSKDSEMQQESVQNEEVKQAPSMDVEMTEATQAPVPVEESNIREPPVITETAVMPEKTIPEPATISQPLYQAENLEVKTAPSYSELDESVPERQSPTPLPDILENPAKEIASSLSKMIQETAIESIPTSQPSVSSIQPSAPVHPSPPSLEPSSTLASEPRDIIPDPSAALKIPSPTNPSLPPPLSTPTPEEVLPPLPATEVSPTPVEPSVQVEATEANKPEQHPEEKST